MDYGKYIIVEIRGIETAILFDPLIAHSDFLESFNLSKIRSAGFFMVGAKKSDTDPDDIHIGCWGKSVSLGNMPSRPQEDPALIKRILRKDFT